MNFSRDEFDKKMEHDLLFEDQSQQFQKYNTIDPYKRGANQMSSPLSIDGTRNMEVIYENS